MCIIIVNVNKTNVANWGGNMRKSLANLIIWNVEKLSEICVVYLLKEGLTELAINGDRHVQISTANKVFGAHIVI